MGSVLHRAREALVRAGLLASVVVTGTLVAWPSSASAATCDFEDTGPGIWHSDADWTCGHIPTTGDTAVIDSGDTVTVNQNDTVPALNLDGGTISLTNSAILSVSGAMTVTGGTLTSPLSPSDAISVESTGSFSNSGSLTVTGTDLLLNANGTLTGNISLTDVSGTPHLRIRKDLTISGTAGFPSATSGSSPYLIVEGPNGHLIKDGSGTSLVRSLIDNDGEVTTEAGTLWLRNGGGTATSAGTFETLASATTEFSGPVSLDAAGGTITGAGVTKLSNTTGPTNSGVISVPSGAVFTPSSLSFNGACSCGVVGAVQNTGGLSNLTLNSLDVAGEGGSLSGAFTTTIPPSGSFTTNGRLNLKNGADLVLNAEAHILSGGICLDGSSSTDELVQVNATLTIDSSGFPCTSSDTVPQLFVNGPGGRIVLNPSANIHAKTEVSGTVTVASGQSLAVSSGMDLVAGGVLNGGGVISGDVTNSAGTVRPGSSAGTLTLNNDYTQGAAAKLEVEVNGTTPGTQFDVLDVNGAANLDGTLKVIQGAFEPAFTDTFAVLTSASRTGTFATLDAPALPNGKTYLVTYPGSPDFGAQLGLVPGGQPGHARCARRAATITGTGKKDKLRGTARADVIAALGGNDTIRGLAGNDIICGGGGKDTILGGPGKDRLLGQAGRDTLRGGPGRDKLKGGPGRDTQLQ
jgi:hypothetical protein